MQLLWQKGRFSWIASHPDCITEPSKQFPLSAAPENQAINALSQKLLSHGGEAVVVPFVEENSCTFLDLHLPFSNHERLYSPQFSASSPTKRPHSLSPLSLNAQTG
jgi:hypothetical protein